MEASKGRWRTAYQLEVAAHDSSGQEEDNSNMENLNVYL